MTAAITFAGSATSGGRILSSSGPYRRQMSATLARYSAWVGSAFESALKTRMTTTATATARAAQAAPSSTPGCLITRTIRSFGEASIRAPDLMTGRLVRRPRAARRTAMTIAR